MGVLAQADSTETHLFEEALTDENPPPQTITIGSSGVWLQNQTSVLQSNVLCRFHWDALRILFYNSIRVGARCLVPLTLSEKIQLEAYVYPETSFWFNSETEFAKKIHPQISLGAHAQWHLAEQLPQENIFIDVQYKFATPSPQSVGESDLKSPLNRLFLENWFQVWDSRIEFGGFFTNPLLQRSLFKISGFYGLPYWQRLVHGSPWYKANFNGLGIEQRIKVSDLNLGLGLNYLDIYFDTVRLTFFMPSLYLGYNFLP